MSESKVSMYVRAFHTGDQDSLVAADSVWRGGNEFVVNMSNGESVMYTSGTFYVMSLHGKTIAEYNL